MVFSYFWNIEFVMHWKNIEIRCVFQQKCSLSSMELLKIPLFCSGFLTFLKSWIHKNLRNHWNSIGNTRNAAHWHRWNYSKNHCFLSFSFIFEIMNSCWFAKMLYFKWNFNNFAHSCRWSYSKKTWIPVVFFKYFWTLVHLWFMKILIFR